MDTIGFHCAPTFAIEIDDTDHYTTRRPPPPPPQKKKKKKKNVEISGSLPCRNAPLDRNDVILQACQPKCAASQNVNKPGQSMRI